MNEENKNQETSKNYGGNKDNGSKETEPERRYEPIAIRKVEMVGASKTAFTTSRAMGNTITDALKEVSDDVVACTIYTKPKEGVVANLILTDNKSYYGNNDSGKCKLVTPFRKQMNTMGTLKRMYEMQNRVRKYLTLTDEAKFKLKDFVPNSFIGNRGGQPIYVFDPKHKNVRWDMITKEFIDRTNIYTEPRVFLAVRFDLNKWLKKVYGTTGKNGEHLDYVISPIRPEQAGRYAYLGQSAVSYVLSYTQLNEEELKRNIMITNGELPDFNPSFCAF